MGYLAGPTAAARSFSFMLVSVLGPRGRSSIMISLRCGDAGRDDRGSTAAG
jgi:hypothetical protein